MPTYDYTIQNCYTDHSASPENDPAGTTNVSVQIEPHSGGYRITIGDRQVDIESYSVAESRVAFVANGQQNEVFVSQPSDLQRDGSHRHRGATSFRLWHRGSLWQFERNDQSRSSRRTNRQVGSGSLRASMPSQILAVEVRDGDVVKKGDTLVTLEAMKMETKLAAPFDGVVKRVGCSVGDVVKKDQVLVVLDPLE